MEEPARRREKRDAPEDINKIQIPNISSSIFYRLQNLLYLFLGLVQFGFTKSNQFRYPLYLAAQFIDIQLIIFQFSHDILDFGHSLFIG